MINSLIVFDISQNEAIIASPTNSKILQEITHASKFNNSLSDFSFLISKKQFLFSRVPGCQYLSNIDKCYRKIPGDVWNPQEILQS